MYEFNATISDNSINIESSTYWSCKVEGNFKLSKYDGSGNTILNIIIPDDVMIAEGVVYFSFGDERCKYPTLQINNANINYISSSPNYSIVDDKKTITFYYEKPSEVFTFSFFCFDRYEITTTNCSYVRGRDRNIMVFPQDNDGELVITPANTNNGKKILYVKLIKKQHTCE